MSTALADRAIAEVQASHAFFTGWFRAGDEGNAGLAAFERALAADFRRVAPDGRVEDKAATMAAIRLARGTAPADFAIAVLQPQPVWQVEAAVLLEFVEQQYRGGETTKRRSTALFTPDPSAPRGVVWRHLHETWMPADKTGKS